MNEKELITLVNLAAKKDNAALEKLYNRYYTDIIFVCRKYNLSDADADDIAQDTFIKAFTELNTLNDPAKFPSWLMRIASNKCLNLIKHNNVISFSSTDDEDAPLEIPDKQKSADDIIIDKEVREIIAKMIEGLPIEQRVTIFMYYYQDYSVKEIAAAYGCSENTVKSRLNYARKAMREEAEKLENQGIKLRTVAILPFLYIFFAAERDVFACEIPDCASVIGKVMTMGGKAAASSTASAVVAGAKTGFFTTLAGKVAIGIGVAVIAIGGIVAAVVSSGNKDKETDKAPTYESVLDNTTSATENEKEDATTTAPESNENGILPSKYDYKINYVNEEGMASGNLVFNVRQDKLIWNNSSCIQPEEYVIGTYKYNNVIGQDFYKDKSNGIYFYDLEMPYTNKSKSDEFSLYDTVDGCGHYFMIERISASTAESVEEFVQNFEYDDYSKGEMFQYGDYYVYLMGAPRSISCAYKYFDQNSVIRIMAYVREDDPDFNNHFLAMLDRISFEYVGTPDKITGTDKAYNDDLFAKAVFDKFGLCIKDYSFIKKYDYREFIYETPECKYTIESYHDMTDVLEEYYPKLGTLESGVNVYISKELKSTYTLLTEKNGHFALIKMSCDIPKEDTDAIFDQIRKDLLQ